MANIGHMFIFVNMNNDANKTADKLCLVKMYQKAVIVV